MTTTTGITTTITVRRLPGQPTWEVLVNGKFGMASPSRDAVADAAIAAVAANGGRAVVEYRDENSMQDRARRKRLNQKTASEIGPGDSFHVRFSNDHNAYVPCSGKAPGWSLFTVTGASFNQADRAYVFRDTVQPETTAIDDVDGRHGIGWTDPVTRKTRPFLPHEIIQLTEV
jgi:hypothetical protein